MKLRLPKALKPGDTIGLAGPSGSVRKIEQVEKSAAKLKELGFNVVIGSSCSLSYGYLSASDELRASDINDFFANPNIDGIVCIKGGYGTPRILDKLDYNLIASNPKILAGYSDITGLHSAFSRYAGFPTFHSPMATSMLGSFDDFSKQAWLRALCSTEPLGLLAQPEGMQTKSLVEGASSKVSGKLVGGNLSLVAALVGTPYSIDPRNAIIFLEDVNEEPYKIDRMLTQLRLAGFFDSCAGIILGTWKNCEPAEPERSLTLEQVFKDIIAPAKKPCIINFAAGHASPTLSFPLGVIAELNTYDNTVSILESACE